jgi:hypothetical protein
MALPGGVRLFCEQRLRSAANQPQERTIKSLYWIFEREPGRTATPNEAV